MCLENSIFAEVFVCVCFFCFVLFCLTCGLFRYFSSFLNIWWFSSYLFAFELWWHHICHFNPLTLLRPASWPSFCHCSKGPWTLGAFSRCPLGSQGSNYVSEGFRGLADTSPARPVGFWEKSATNFPRDCGSVPVSAQVPQQLLLSNIRRPWGCTLTLNYLIFLMSQIPDQ